MAAVTPGFRTVKETALAWGVSGRYVNMCIADGRVGGALRMGNIWLVPNSAEKPGRAAKPGRQSPCAVPPQKDALSADIARVVEATVGPWPANEPDAILATVPEARLRLQYEGEFAYLRGDFARVVQCFREIGHDGAAKLRACPLTIAAAICTGNYALYTEMESYLQNIIQSNNSGDIKIVAELALNTAYVSAIAPNMVSGWLKDGDFSALPPLARADAAFKRAKYFQGLGQFEPMLAVAETALALCDPPEGISYAGIYLRLVCAAACHALGRVDKAESWLHAAMHMALPHGFITPFAESAPACGGLLEKLLEQEYPAHLSAVTAQWRRTFANWMAFHNQFTRQNITSMLSMREYEMAALVVQHVPRAQIAQRFHISPGRLNNIMKEIYGKLFVSGREELAKFIL